MTVHDKIRNEKLYFDINKEAAKILALSSGKIDGYEYLTGEEILHTDQSRMKEQAEFTYCPLGKALEKQTKTIEYQGRKQIDSITHQNERLAPLINKDDINLSHKYLKSSLKKDIPK